MAGAAVVAVRLVTRIAAAAKTRCGGMVAAIGLRVAARAALRRTAGGFMISDHCRTIRGRDFADVVKSKWVKDLVG